MEDFYRFENDNQDDEVIFLDELPIPGEVNDPNEYPSDADDDFRDRLAETELSRGPSGYSPPEETNRIDWQDSPFEQGR